MYRYIIEEDWFEDYHECKNMELEDIEMNNYKDNDDEIKIGRKYTVSWDDC
jgi:hypothetical protein